MLWLNVRPLSGEPSRHHLPDSTVVSELMHMLNSDPNVSVQLLHGGVLLQPEQTLLEAGLTDGAEITFCLNRSPWVNALCGENAWVTGSLARRIQGVGSAVVICQKPLDTFAVRIFGEQNLSGSVLEVGFVDHQALENARSDGMPDYLQTVAACCTTVHGRLGGNSRILIVELEGSMAAPLNDNWIRSLKPDDVIRCTLEDWSRGGLRMFVHLNDVTLFDVVLPGHARGSLHPAINLFGPTRALQLED